MNLAATLVLVSLVRSIHADEPPTTDSPAASEAPVEEIDEPREPPQELKKKIARGKPAAYQSGAVHGFWIWREGKTWHVRTTTKSVQHRFTGRVAVPDKARIVDVRSTRSELKDRLRLAEHVVKFDFTTNGHADGFDFDVEGPGCVRFTLKIDGEPRPDIVNLGKDGKHPDSWHFALCS